MLRNDTLRLTRDEKVLQIENMLQRYVLIKFMTEPNDDLGTKRNIGSIWEEHLGIYFSTRV